MGQSRLISKRRNRHSRNLAVEQLESIVLLSNSQSGTPDYYGSVPNWAYSPQPTVEPNGELTGGIEKFVDSLPGLTAAGANDLGQYLPVAIPDTVTYPGSQYYEIAVIQYTERLHQDLARTTLRGYVQLETPMNAQLTDGNGQKVSLHFPLSYPDGSPILDHGGNQVYAFDKPSYLGPTVIAQANIPVRVKFTNYLPTGEGGDLFLPVDTTTMGAGAGPIDAMPAGQGSVMTDGQYVTINLDMPLEINAGEYAELSGFTPAAYNGRFLVTGLSTDHMQVTVRLNSDPGGPATVHPDPRIPNDPLMTMVAQAYTQNRAVPHLHGGNTVWISDGNMYQWITPEGENTSYPNGVSVHNVPDMPDPGDGSMTFFYSNQQSARLMWVHDHAEGITRLNVYAGEAMGYMLTDQVEQDLINRGILPDLGTPLIIQDKTFIDPNTVLNTDPTWPLPVDQSGGSSNLWTPHVYMPNQNPNSPDGANPMGRWDYGPFFWPPWPTTYAPIAGVGDLALTGGGSGYVNAPTVTFLPNPGDTTGYGATATARIDVQNGTVSAIPVNDPGAQYTLPPVVTLTAAPGDAGTGATAKAMIDGNGFVTGINVVTPGRGYRVPPLVAISPAPADAPDSIASATAAIDAYGAVTGLTLVNHGSGYNLPPIVMLSPPETPGGTTATAIAASWLYPNYPNVSMTMESFQDTPLVNGTAYPYMDVDPQSYRFRVLDASDDRMWNLQLYTASTILDKITITNPGSGYLDEPDVTITPAPGDTTGMGATAEAIIDERTGALLAIQIETVGSGYTLPPIVTLSAPESPGGTRATATATIYTGQSEVGMVPAVKGAANFPKAWTVQTPGQPGDILDGRFGGVPDPRTIGPDIIQIGNDGGFLPTPVILHNTPIGFERNPKNIVIGNVSQHNLFLGPAERADILIDFSQFAGKTIILYNDGPAAVPAADSRMDYFTNDMDQTTTGGTTSTHAGYGPNTRTVMVFRVSTKAAHPLDVQALMDEFATTSTHVGVFERDQAPVIVPQAGYNSAYNANFPTGNSAYARIQDTSLTFQPLDLSQPTNVSPTPVTIQFQPKAIQELFDNDTGRMSGFLGVELPFTNGGNQTTIPYTYNDPVTEIIADTPNTRMIKIGDLGDGTQIWKVTHNGVDTHPVHFHLFDVQLINRVGWDGQIKPPDANELGWKETVRMNPLEDCIVALRPTAAKVPFGVPESVRLLNPDMAPGYTWRSFDATTGNPITVTNTVSNFGWEYMWHCHILSHEEMMMMRPIEFNVAVQTPEATTVWQTRSPDHVDLEWIDPTPADDPGTPGNPKNEIGWLVERAILVGGEPGAFTVLKDLPANTARYSDPTVVPDSGYVYRVTAYNAAGDAANELNVPEISVSTNAEGEHGTGETISISLTFSQPVFVTGSPELALNTTGSPGKGVYSSGSGTTTLSFVYQIAPGQEAHPLDYASTTALTLPEGATIRYGNGADANLTLPEPGTLSDGLFVKDIQIDPKYLPSIVWPAPTAITFGLALSLEQQLNARAYSGATQVQGRFTYSPVPGTVLDAGAGQLLSVTFVPRDTTHYQSVTGTQSITVLKASPSISVSVPSPITYGDPWVLIAGTLAAPYPAVFPAGQVVAITVGSGAPIYTTNDSTGAYSYRLDTSKLAASATPYPIRVSYAGGTNFNPAESSTSLTVNPRSVSVAANAVSKPCGNPDPALTYQITSGTLAPGDSFQGSLTREPGEVAGQYPILQGTLTLGPNYDLGYRGAMLTIEPPLPTETSLSSSTASSVYGQEVAFTARVQTQGGTLPGGSVEFLDGASVLDTVALVDGVAHCSTSSLAVAGHSITAKYLGDAFRAGSQSQVVGEVVTASPTRTTLEIDAPPNRRWYLLEVYVTPAFTGVAMPTGSAVLFVGNRAARTIPVVNGMAELAVSRAALNRKWVKAYYTSDTPSFTSSASRPISVARAHGDLGIPALSSLPSATMKSRRTPSRPPLALDRPSLRAASKVSRAATASKQPAIVR